ncbi:MAG: saccharopine dehydrogenase NADP-binding domain-containing protein [Candidatus Aminicenantes bacterium]|nr:saccharopine dehydrogenase NADP-binding domain-containing protein [Candidatus Aminicenantes bacterium]
MNHFLVLGAGKMGIVLANDLLDSGSDNKVTLVDIDFEALKRAKDFIQNDRLETLQRNIEDKAQRDSILEGKDVVLCALLHRHSLMVLESAVRYGVHFLDLAGEKILERLEYDEDAQRKAIAVITGCGVSPGITNACVGRGLHLLDETENAVVYVGGNPLHPKPPLSYRIVYSLDSLLNFYERKALIIKDGRLAKVPALSALEPIAFSDPFREMECFYTDGLNSMTTTMKGKIKGELAEKTIRHKGHIQGINTLKECGLFSSEPVEVGDRHIIPRKVLEALLNTKMNLGNDQDVTLLRIIVSGIKDGRRTIHTFEMEDYYDSEKHFTSMAKTTSFPASIMAQMVLSGDIEKRGVFFPEDVLSGALFEPFMQSLKSRGVVVSQRVTHE